MRAQAYYAIAGAARSHLHRRIGDLLSEDPSIDDAVLSLQVAWHYLRGDNRQRALPFGLRGAEAFLAVGAPHEAEEVLRALAEFQHSPKDNRSTGLLLAKALVDQSKVDAALPLINKLDEDPELSRHERAQVAMLRASAEFALNSEPGEKYCEAAKISLTRANETGDPALIGQALFECARAGTEQGLPELIRLAERSEEHTSELQSRLHLVCRLLLEKKKKIY